MTWLNSLCYPAAMSTPILARSRLDAGSTSGAPDAAPLAHTFPASLPTFSPWCWLLVPLFAITAYASVVRVGFLSDDLGLLNIARLTPWDSRVLLWPDTTRLWYRPVGYILTWQVGRELWGLNPLPYHLLGLLAHAGASLVLGLWLATVAANRALGWLAGLLFAVFPGNLEAVAWIAAQWDAWAAFFVILSLWLFALWWRSRAEGRANARASLALSYALSLLFYTFAVFTKESVLAFLPVFALSAWLLPGRLMRSQIPSLMAALAPFVAVWSLNVAIRLAAWGNMPNYAFARTDYGNFFWDELVARSRLLIAPINADVLGGVVQQAAGAVGSVALLLGLLWLGRLLWRLLLVSAVWVTLALMVTINLPLNTQNLQNNRFLYLAAAGYCAGIAALLYSALATLRQRTLLIAAGIVGLLLVLGLAASWVQLQPFNTASIQVTELDRELDALIPLQSRPDGFVWYVENRPSSYKGVYVLQSGLGRLRYLQGGGTDIPQIEYVQSAALTPLAKDQRDAFALRFEFDPTDTRFHVGFASGITSQQPPPAGPGIMLWDFRDCAPRTLSQWQPVNAQAFCESGKGLTVLPETSDPQLVNSNVQLSSALGARFIRLRVAASYTGPDAVVSQWFWKGQGEDFQEERSSSLSIAPGGKARVYWTFIPVSRGEQAISSLRFDPMNTMTAARIEWIAVESVGYSR